MNLKLTPAQEKLINALKKDPDGDAYEHLIYIRNRKISDKLVNTMLHLNLLKKDPETGKINLNYENPVLKCDMAVEIGVDATSDKPAAYQPDDSGEMAAESNEAAENSAEETEIAAPDSETKTDAPNQNKKAVILEMLTRRASLSEMMEATGWLEKSVRGVISQLKKEKNLVIIREKDENKQNYYSIKMPNAANE